MAKEYPLPFKFQWWRPTDGRFRLEKKSTLIRQPKPENVHSRAGTQSYEPLDPDIFPGLLTAFARVCNARTALEFVNRFGPLTREGQDFRKGESADLLRKKAIPISEMLDASARNDQAELAGLIDNDPIFGTLQMWLEPDFNGRSGPRMSLTSPDLLNAILFGLAKKLARGAIFRCCPRCGDYFEAGIETREAGKRVRRTKSAKFCCDAHRIEYNTLKATEASK